MTSYSCDANVQDVANGFISSPLYPNDLTDIGNCDIILKPRANYGYKIYIIDLALSDINVNGT